MPQGQSHQSESIHETSRGAVSRNDSEIYRRLNDLEQWRAGHQGTCTERHEARQQAQRRTDDDVACLEGRIDKLTQDVVDLKVKLALIAGTAAAGGGTIGGLIASWFGAG